MDCFKTISENLIALKGQNILTQGAALGAGR